MHQQTISKSALEDIRLRLTSGQMVKRTPLSVRFPRLKPAILFARQSGTRVKNSFNRRIATKRIPESLPYRIHKHASLLRRKLGSSDMRLQENKITNLAMSIKAIDGIVIKPGEVFSLWSLIGKPTRRKGYVDGMLLSKGKVIEGMGGGLCQLANLLHWMFLHAPLEITERYHHSLDVFPDSGRTIPFGSGATILYNFIDLKAKNVSKSPIQIRLSLTDTKLVGELRTTNPDLEGYRVKETDHCFVLFDHQWYRYNRLWRVSRLKNKKLVSEPVVTNLAPVLYEVNEEKLRRDGYTVVKA